jgi:hypothetical protein
MNHDTTMKPGEESQALDRQSDEPTANGHTPDFRFCQPCDWYFSNPWRCPAGEQPDFGGQFDVIRNTIRVFSLVGDVPHTILEGECGAGCLCRRLARPNLNVTGLDPRCIETASRSVERSGWHHA